MGRRRRKREDTPTKWRHTQYLSSDLQPLLSRQLSRPLPATTATTTAFLFPRRRLLLRRQQLASMGRASSLPSSSSSSLRCSDVGDVGGGDAVVAVRCPLDSSVLPSSLRPSLTPRPCLSLPLCETSTTASECGLHVLLASSLAACRVDTLLGPHSTLHSPPSLVRFVRISPPLSLSRARAPVLSTAERGARRRRRRLLEWTVLPVVRRSSCRGNRGMYSSTHASHDSHLRRL